MLTILYAPAMKKNHPRSSRARYREFVEAYRRRRLDESGGAPEPKRPAPAPRREYLREYLRWLWPHRFAVGAVFAFAVAAAGLQMVEPLFMRFIIDRVLLNEALDAA